MFRLLKYIYTIAAVMHSLCQTVCQTLSQSKVSTKKTKINNMKKKQISKKKMPNNGIATCPYKTTNSNGLKWLCATVEFATGDNNKEGVLNVVTMKRQTVMSQSLSNPNVK